VVTLGSKKACFEKRKKKTEHNKDTVLGLLTGCECVEGHHNQQNTRGKKKRNIRKGPFSKKSGGQDPKWDIENWRKGSAGFEDRDPTREAKKKLP